MPTETIALEVGFTTNSPITREGKVLPGELPGGQIARGGRPDMPDRQRHEHPPQRLLLDRLQVGEQLQADGEGGGRVGVEVAPLPAALHQRQDVVVRAQMP